MIIMQVNGLTKSFGAEEILSNIKMQIKHNDRIAIVGRNGAGKSTLLKILAGELSYDAGEIIQRKGLTIGYLSQHNGLESQRTIWNEMLDVFQPLLDQEKELRRIEQKMADIHAFTEGDYQKLLQDYDRLQQSFETNGGYRYEADIRTVLSGLNFLQYDDDTPIHTLSGGQKTRLALGKLLLQKPDLLILDEPTNHLDMETLTWLEGYLGSYPGAIVIVSHDRYFLDKTVSIVYDLSRHHMKKYHGTYSEFLKQKALAFEMQQKEYDKQQATIKDMEQFIQRNIARASTTKRAQSRRKQLEKMVKVDKPLTDEARATFSFQINRRSGNDVLKINDLSFQYSGTDQPLFTNVQFHVNRGERIAIIGPNGVGKSTLLKMITGQLTPTRGTIQFGTNVQIGYYDQEQANLNTSNTVLQELWGEYPHVNEKDIRTILGNFLFSGDDVLKDIHSLSGGEKARLALAKLKMKQANVLILDEPTNHLDIDSKEVLEAALIDYPGTIIFVSHDRYFMNKIADQVLEMRSDGITVYLGNYDYYVEKKQEELELNQLEQPDSTSPSIQQGKLNYQQEKKLQREQRKKRRHIQQLEETIDSLEMELANLEMEMTKPDVYEDHEMALKYMNKTESLKEEIEQYMNEWTTLQEDED